MDPIPDDPGRRGAVAIILRGDRMLVIRRSRDVVAPLTYCFPGGGIEDGESEQAALIREVREEVGVTIRPVRHLWQCVTAWKVQLVWWLAEMDREATPVPNPAEVESIHWVTVGEMAQLPGLLDSNRLFLELIEQGAIRLDGDAGGENGVC
jgi:8-oxo-dGTP diphosphatase